MILGPPHDFETHHLLFSAPLSLQMGKAGLWGLFDIHGWNHSDANLGYPKEG